MALFIPEDAEPPAPPIPSLDRGPSLRLLGVAGSPDGWSAAGFEVGDTGFVQIGTTTVIPAGSGVHPPGWAFEPNPTIGDIDGIPVLTVSEFPEVDPRPAAHPNGITSIDHVVIATDDPLRTSTALADAGFPERRSIITERFGAPLRQTFHWAGDVIIEVIGPETSTHDDDPLDATDQVGFRPPAGVSSANGPDLFGITFVSPDIDHTIRVMGEIMSEPRPAVQPGRLISTINTRTLDIGTRLAVMTPHESHHI